MVVYIGRILVRKVTFAKMCPQCSWDGKNLKTDIHQKQIGTLAEVTELFRDFLSISLDFSEMRVVRRNVYLFQQITVQNG